MKLFWQDSYLTEFDSRISDIIDDKVILEQTAFYAESGGQMGDTGHLNGVRIVDTQCDENGTIIYHIIDPNDIGKLKKDEPVHGVIDWDRRYKIMRLHSALHIASLVFEQKFGKQKFIGSQVREDKARMDMEFFEKIDAPEIQNRLNEVIAQNHPIRIYTDEKDADYRYWEIEGYEVIPCGGTHVKNTSEIGAVKLKRKSLGAQGLRIYCSIID